MKFRFRGKPDGLMPRRKRPRRHSEQTMTPEMISKNRYMKRNYKGFRDGPGIVDVLKNKVTGAATNIIGGAANSASGSVNSAFQGVKLPPVSLSISKDTQTVIFKAVGVLSIAAIAVAFIAKK